MQEITHLVRKGALRLNTLFYLGVVFGLVLGPVVLIASAIPAVRAALLEAEAGVEYMVPFGLGMTLLLGIASVEQWVKVRKHQKLLAALGDNPHHITGLRKETVKDAATHVHFSLRDGTRAKVWLAEADADRLLSLLESTHLIFCPYCITPIPEETVLCPRCAQDTTRDAPLEMTLTEYREMAQTTCPHCGATLPSLAVRCPACGEKP